MKLPILSTLAVAFLPLSLSQADDGWELLFDGKTLAGWTHTNGKPVSKGWKVEDGAIHRGAERGGDIITEKEYENFVMEFEWKISEGGNSGVKYRAHGSLGLEYQVLDDSKHADAKNPTHQSASLYDLLAAPADKPVKPVGEWNKGRIVAEGTRLEHWLNGVKVVSIDQSGDDWKARFAKSKYKKNKGFGFGPGRILLQDHGNQVWFRNLRVKVLKAGGGE